MRRHEIAATLAVAMLCAPAAARAQTADPAAGAKIAENGSASGAPACSSCHGDHGEGQPESGFPRLAGQVAAFLVHQLDSFADGKRPNPIMAPIATALSPQQRVDVSAHFETFQAVSPPTPPQDAKAAARGYELAATGDWPRGLPACSQCHGLKGEGVGAAFPMISGQNALYIETQLKAWRAGERKDDPMGLMRAVASKLSDEDIAAVAGFYAGAAVWAGQPSPSASRASTEKKP
jgi:cytochrome c553